MRNAAASAGFTLLEIMVVVFLIAAVTAVLIANLDAGSGIGLQSSMRVVSAELRYASQKAVSSSRMHRWVVDLDEQLYRTEGFVLAEAPGPFELPATPELMDLLPPDAEDGEFVPVDSSVGNWTVLRDSVQIDEICVADHCESTGVQSIRFSPDGGAEPAVVWLVDNQDYAAKVVVVGFTGEINAEFADE